MFAGGIHVDVLLCEKWLSVAYWYIHRNISFCKLTEYKNINRRICIVWCVFMLCYTMYKLCGIHISVDINSSHTEIQTNQCARAWSSPVRVLGKKKKKKKWALLHIILWDTQRTQTSMISTYFVEALLSALVHLRHRQRDRHRLRTTWTSHRDTEQLQLVVGKCTQLMEGREWNHKNMYERVREKKERQKRLHICGRRRECS